MQLRGNGRGWGILYTLPPLCLTAHSKSSVRICLIHIFEGSKCQTYTRHLIYLSLNCTIVHMFCAEFNIKSTHLGLILDNLPKTSCHHLLPLSKMKIFSTNLPCVAIPNNDHTIDTFVGRHYPSFVLTGAGTAYVVGLNPWGEKNIIVKGFL